MWPLTGIEIYKGGKKKSYFQKKTEAESLIIAQ